MDVYKSGDYTPEEKLNLFKLEIDSALESATETGIESSRLDELSQIAETIISNIKNFQGQQDALKVLNDGLRSVGAAPLVIGDPARKTATKVAKQAGPIQSTSRQDSHTRSKASDDSIPKEKPPSYVESRLSDLKDRVKELKIKGKSSLNEKDMYSLREMTRKILSEFEEGSSEYSEIVREANKIIREAKYGK